METSSTTHKYRKASLSKRYINASNPAMPPPPDPALFNESGGEDSDENNSDEGDEAMTGENGDLNEDTIFDADEDPKQKLDLTQIQLELYQRKCAKLNICPVGAYLRNPGSSVLNIANYCLGPNGALALSVPLTLDNCVTHLYMQGTGIGAEGLRCLAPCFHDNITITHLNLDDNDLGSEGAMIIGKVLVVSGTLESVSLCGNNFKDSDTVYLTEGLLDPDRRHLTHLDLSRNQLGDAAAVLFGEVLANNDLLESLDLSWNQIRPRGGLAIMNGLKDNAKLKKLALARNGLGDAGCEAAGVTLTTNRSLLELDLSGNRISNKGMLSLAKNLGQNDTLQILKMGDNLATGLGTQALVEAIFRADECAIRELDLTGINVFDILVQAVEEHAESHPLQLKHGPVSRFVLPRDELEKKFVEEFKTKHPEPTPDATFIVTKEGEEDTTAGEPEASKEGEPEAEVKDAPKKKGAAKKGAKKKKK